MQKNSLLTVIPIPTKLVKLIVTDKIPLPEHMANANFLIAPLVTSKVWAVAVMQKDKRLFYCFDPSKTVDPKRAKFNRIADGCFEGRCEVRTIDARVDASTPVSSALACYDFVRALMSNTDRKFGEEPPDRPLVRFLSNIVSEAPFEVDKDMNTMLHEVTTLIIARNERNTSVAKMRVEEFLSLDIGSWVLDSVMTAYIDMLINTFGSSFERASSAGRAALPLYGHVNCLLSAMMTAQPERGESYLNTANESIKQVSHTCIRMLFPFNMNYAHWCLVVIDTEKSSITVYDSLSTSDHEYLFGLFRQMPLCANMTMRTQPNTPKQKNQVDCGVYTLIFARCLLQNTPMDSKTFSDKNMPYIRQVMKRELLEGYILPLSL